MNAETPCPFCQEAYESGAILQRHVSFKHFNTAVKCAHCEKTFNSEDDFQNHQEKDHSPTTPVTHFNLNSRARNMPPEKPISKCDACDQVLKNDYEKIIHQNGQKVPNINNVFYTCQIAMCFSKFCTEDGLEYHQFKEHFKKIKNESNYLRIAAQQNRIDIVKWLIENGANPNTKDDMHNTALHFASRTGSRQVLKYLIEYGADLKAKDKEENTPLHFAFSPEVAFLLIENGANIDAKNNEGRTALHTAIVWKRKSNVVKFLIEKGAKVESKDKWGLTTLHYAVRYGEPEIVKFLLETNAKINAKTNSGYTPLHYTPYNWNVKMVKLLIEKGALIDEKDVNGNTPLIMISKYNYSCVLEIVKLLVENGASIDQKNNKGNTALDVAKRKTVVEYLTLKKTEILNAATPEETISNKDPCIICFGPRNGFFILWPCAHASLCEICCKKLTTDQFGKCPECRQPVKEYKKIFHAGTSQK